MCQSVIVFKRLNTVRVRDFMTDGSQKVKDTHGAHCREINPVGYPCVSLPLGEMPPKAFFELSKLQRETPPTSGADSMKADSIKLRDAYTLFIHLQVPRSPVSTVHPRDKTNLTFN